MFFAALTPWVAAELSARIPDRMGLLSLPLLAVFAMLVRRYRRLRDRRRRVEVAERLAAESVARIDRDWDALSEPVAPPAELGATHPWAFDLDLHGRASLRQLLGPVATPMGRRTLDRWLLEPLQVDALPERQAAVAELADETELREEVAVEAALLDAVDPDALRRFLAWCTAPPELTPTAGRLAWALPLLTLGLAVADGFGWAPDWSWVAPLAVSGWVAWKWGARLHLHFVRASSGVPGIRRYHRLLALWEQGGGEAPVRAASVAALREGSRPASEALLDLESSLQMADARFSSLHPVIAVGLLWDLHVGRALDRWRAEHGDRVEHWMEALGRLEALSAVATLAGEHPEWARPSVAASSAPPVFEARSLGHPLLPDGVAVRNDVSLGPPGTVLLITGSNMSGKSTLLRSIGLAVVMTGLGAPVCAAAARVPGCRLHTSMRVQDSLAAGVSFFMAELQRLAAILAEAPPAGSDAPPLLYLVDEILQGTNSEERQVAGRRFVRHLLRSRAIGAVTTHDLSFHDHPEVEAASDLVHFRESLAADDGIPGLHFDYQLRPGLATTRNALRLAEQVGLTDPDAGTE